MPYFFLSVNTNAKPAIAISPPAYVGHPIHLCCVLLISIGPILTTFVLTGTLNPRIKIITIPITMRKKPSTFIVSILDDALIIMILFIAP